MTLHSKALGKLLVINDNVFLLFQAGLKVHRKGSQRQQATKGMKITDSILRTSERSKIPTKELTITPAFL